MAREEDSDARFEAACKRHEETMIMRSEIGHQKVALATSKEQFEMEKRRFVAEKYDLEMESRNLNAAKRNFRTQKEKFVFDDEKPENYCTLCIDGKIRNVAWHCGHLVS